MAVTSSMLLDIKSVKMLGLADVLHGIVSRLRKIELKTSEGFRSLLVWQIVICTFTFLLHPPLPFVLIRMPLH